jgi:DNA polymerase III delta subunit
VSRQRKKLTREEKAKRNVQKAKRRSQVGKVKKAMREFEEIERKAKQAGIELPDPQEQKRYGRGEG